MNELSKNKPLSPSEIKEIVFSATEFDSSHPTRASIVNLLRAFANHDNQIEVKGDGRILLLLSLSYFGRSDHERKIDAVNGLTNNSTVVKGRSKGTKKFSSLRLRLKSAFSVIRCMKSIRKISSDKGVRNFLMLQLFDIFLTWNQIIDVARKKNIHFRLLVSLSDVHPIDYYTTQGMKKLHVATATLQHGIFSHYAPLSFKNSPSDYFLAYNELTMMEAEKSGYSGKMINVGPPVLINGAIKKMNISHHGIIGVALTGYTPDENERIFTALGQVHNRCIKKIIIRDHPGCHTDISHVSKAVDDSSKTLEEFFDKCDFVITGNSTTFFEALLDGKLAIRLKTEKDIYSVFDYLYFNNPEQLNSIINKVYDKVDMESYFPDKAKRLLYPKGNVRENYIEFLRKYDTLQSQ